MSEVETTKGFICYECLNRKKSLKQNQSNLKTFKHISDLAAHKYRVHGIDMGLFVQETEEETWVFTIRRKKNNGVRGLQLKLYKFDTNSVLPDSHYEINSLLSHTIPDRVEFISVMSFEEMKKHALYLIQ